MSVQPGASPSASLPVAIGLPAEDARRFRGVWPFRNSPATKLVLSLLANDPQGWVDQYGNGCVLSHAASRLHIWVGNEAYGLGYWEGSRDSTERKLAPRARERRAIWRAVRRAREQSFLERVRAALAKAHPDQKAPPPPMASAEGDAKTGWDRDEPPLNREAGADGLDRDDQQ